MLNQVVLVGRLTSDPEIQKAEEKEFTRITLAVQRSYKNADGVYETDFIPCTLWSSIANNTCEYYKKGDVVGIKGRLQTNDNKMELVAEKVTFLSSRKNEGEEEQ